MEVTGKRSVPAPSDRVWHALNDPQTLKSCIEGCESIEPDGENAYRMVMAAKVGPVSARFTGTMRLVDVDAPHAYTLRFDGNGGAAGFVTGESRVTLAPEGTATTLEFVAKAQVGGKLAQVGSRLIDGVAQKVTDDFFTRFVTALSPPGQAVAAEAKASTGKWRVVTFALILATIIALTYFYLRSRGS
jgi:carbon monoxide dehydrogenase subunit G